MLFIRNTIPLTLIRSVVTTFFAVFVLVTSSSAIAEDKKNNDHITFEKPWIRLLPPTVMHTAGYVTIKNSADMNDRLLDVWSPTINSMSVHQTKEVDGVFKMLAAENLVIPKKGELTMQPGGYHIMIMGLDTPLTEASKVTICFEFEKAGIVHVVFPVQKSAP